MNKARHITLIALAAAAGLLIGAGPAQAEPSLHPLTCDGQQLTVRTTSNNSSDMGGWSAADVVSGGTGTLIPTTFTLSAYDDTVNQRVYDGVSRKGAGNANQNQQTVTCTETGSATLGDLLGSSSPLPPGASPDDHVTLTLTVTAVWQP